MSSDNPVSMAVWTARPPGSNWTAGRRPARLTALLVGLAVLAATLAGLPPISAHADTLGGGTLYGNIQYVSNGASFDPLDTTASGPGNWYAALEQPVAGGLVLVDGEPVRLALPIFGGTGQEGALVGSGTAYAFNYGEGSYSRNGDTIVADIDGLFRGWTVSNQYVAFPASITVTIQAPFLSLSDCSGGCDVPVTGEWHMTDVDGDMVPTEPPGTGERASDDCRLNGGERVVDSATQGVRTSVYLHQPSAGEVWLCGRVEDGVTGDGYGGRLELTPTDLEPDVDPGQVGVPDVDGNATACTTASGNQAPGARPLSQGGVGAVDYMIDAFVDDDQAWLCLRVGSQDVRVMVPLGVDEVPGVSVGGTVATWYPDEGTPGL